MTATSTPRSPGRPAQRRRTRAAILDASIDLVRAGRTPTIDEVAAAAEVSRRTIYMHFPTLDQLIIDATMQTLAGSDIATEFAPDSSALERVQTIVATLHRNAREWLPLGRRMVALTATAVPNGRVKRGHRRVEWIDRAIEPLRDQLTDEQHDRLASSLAILLGWEAMIVLRDIRGLGPRREKAVMSWAAQSLVRAMLEEIRD
jgi:AcrR family transcriptional regulator